MMKLIAGNWKLHGNQGFAEELTSGIVARIEKSDDRLMILCPPFTALTTVVGATRQSCVQVGAQDCSAHEAGAYTGEIAPAMIKELGAQYCIVGHSERRSYHHESNQTVACKAAAANHAGLMPIICVGEQESERDSRKAYDVVEKQLSESVPEDLSAKDFVIAYEPVWAIGTGKVAGVPEIADMHSFIRQRLVAMKGQSGAITPILYGGSVKPSNAAEIMAVDNVGGVLVGGASLKADDFLAIYDAA